MTEYIFDIVASIESDKEFEEITGAELREAIKERLRRLDNDEMLEAVGLIETSDCSED